MRTLFTVLGSVLLLASAGMVHAVDADEVMVLSDSPLRPALTRIAESFQRRTGHTVTFVFGLSPVIEKKVLDGEAAEVVLVQPEFVDELVKAGKVTHEDHPVVARVGIGLFTRANATIPDISTVPALKHTLLDADTLVLSNVATGNYFVTVHERLGVADAVTGKVIRASPADVVLRIVQGTSRDIAVGTITLILEDTRLKLIGPLPDELQKPLVYAAAITTNARAVDPAREFIQFLGSGGARAAMRAVGAE